MTKYKNEKGYITSKLIKIKRIIDKCNLYKTNIVPRTLPTKKLSLFK